MERVGGAAHRQRMLSCANGAYHVAVDCVVMGDVASGNTYLESADAWGCLMDEIPIHTRSVLFLVRAHVHMQGRLGTSIHVPNILPSV